MRVVSSLALALALSTPSLALAQPSSGTVFISGGAFAAIEQAPTTSGFGVPDADASGTVAGGGINAIPAPTPSTIIHLTSLFCMSGHKNCRRDHREFKQTP